MALAKALAGLTGEIPFRVGTLTQKQMIIIAWALVAEELGWRGYLEPSLRTLIGRRVSAAFLTGLIWSAWHYHYILQNGLTVPLYLFVTGAILESFLYSALMRWTGENLHSAMVYHFSWNLFLHVFLINPSDNGGSLIPYSLMIAIEAVFVGIAALVSSTKRNK